MKNVDKYCQEAIAFAEKNNGILDNPSLEQQEAN